MLLAMILCISVLGGCGANRGDSEVVATAGDETVTAGELRYAIAVVKAQSVGQLQGADVEEFWNTSKDGKDAETYIREKGLELILDLAVEAQAAKNAGINVTSDEVDEYLKTNQSAIDQAKESYGVDEAIVREILRKQMFYSKYVERVLMNLPEFTPDDATLEKLFSENFLKAQHILKMNVNETTGEPLPQAEADAKRAELEALLQQARNGADFQALMEANSEDPGSKESPEGYVFAEGEMVPEFYEGTLAIEPNQISDIVETSYGYHIIKRLPLDMEKDLQENYAKVQNLFYQQAELEHIEQLRSTIGTTRDDAKINAIPVKD